MNGDGYADLIVGAVGYITSTGRAYVYHGSPSGLSASPAFSATGAATADAFGFAVAGAGDVNGDGYADVIVGSGGYINNTGRAYVYHGSPGGLSASPAFTATGEGPDDFFGAAVAGAGDVNGDGYADVIVGAYGYSSGTGRAYVYHGSPSGLSASPAFSATGAATNNSFGAAVAGTGDVNGDGYADLIVGADGYDNDTGRAYAFHGGGGRPVLARQMRGGGSSVPVQAWGRSDPNDGFDVRLNATSPAGRQQVKLQVEACPSGVPFGNGACVTQTSPTWTDVTTTSVGIPLTRALSGLSTGALYRWRARVLYAPFRVTAAGITPPPNPAHGPWRRLNAQAVEADVRVNLVLATLNVTRAGTGSGSVVSSPAGIACGEDCSETLNAGTVITLTSTPATGSTFTGWSGDCTGSGACVVTMNGAKSVTANFSLNSYALTTATAGTGSGSVTLDPPGGTYNHGTVVTVTPTPATGSTFTGWSGDCTGSGACVVTMNGAKSVTANFSLNSFAVLVQPTDGLATSEAGAAANFTVVLAAQPTADVTVALASSDVSEGTVSPDALVFTPANWNTPQTVTVTGVDDDVEDGNVAYTIVTTVSSDDPNYNGIAAADVSVTNSDDDGTATANIYLPLIQK